ILRNVMILVSLVAFSHMLYAQSGVKGVIRDSQTKETLIGANVIIEGTSIGVPTDLNGKFKLDAEPGSYTLVITYTGYESLEKEITVQSGNYTDVGNISLVASAFGLSGVAIIADRARERETPVAFSNLDKQQIEEVLGSQDIPMAMNITPNVYSTMQGGGAGDARINVRGFDQSNVAIMINGVPVNDMENGWVYWSNWDGIGDATSSIQMQRGLSAINLATPSVGGTMNVITNPAEQSKGLMYKQEFGSGNFLKSTIMGHTGLINGKYAFSAGGVRKTGEGVIDKTWTDAWAYYFGASYNVNKNNRIEVYAMGAPQRHGQNLYKQNIAAYSHEYARSFDGWPSEALEKFPEANSGRFYNENWGEVSHNYTGKQYWNDNTYDRYNPHFINERENYYHKPLVNLNWYSQFSEKVSLFSTAYYSGGKGGGSGTYGPMAWDYSGPSRMVDFDGTIEDNASNVWEYTEVINDSVEIDHTQPINSNQSVGILRNSINNQRTVGLISKLRWNISERVKASFGIDGRTAEIQHFREVRDLLGGDYFSAYDNDGNRLIDEIKKGSTSYLFPASDFWTTDDYQRQLGDKIDYDFTNTVNWIGGYGQAEYNYGNVTFYGMFGYSMIKYTYTNHFVKDETGDELTAETDWIGGFQVKGGLSYRLTETLSAFANAGYVSKVPIFDAVINDRDGSVATDPENEKFTSFELGGTYTALDNAFQVTLNGYYTTWTDRTNSIGVQLEDGSEGFIFLQGMDQRHIGLELEGQYRPTEALGINFAGSLNNWQYTDNVTGTYKDYSNPDSEESYNYYVNDLKVGDAPQTQFVLGLTLYPLKGLQAQMLGRFYGDHYAFWDPFTRTDETDTEQVWKTPGYTVFDFHASYDLPLRTNDYGLQVFVHVFNVFDELYIQDATDNSAYNGYYGDGEYSHEPWTAEVYLGLPRTYNVGILLTL
ncbi:MAG: TonB-dependent receptor, partial [Bacteroidales bacterium]|nr:TonB-dependent receptor [Bacteroidales bacterium]